MTLFPYTTLFRSINEFLKPAEGESFYGRGRGRGGGRGRGDRGSFRGDYMGRNRGPVAAPSIADQNQFPSLGGKWSTISLLLLKIFICEGQCHNFTLCRLDLSFLLLCCVWVCGSFSSVVQCTSEQTTSVTGIAMFGVSIKYFVIVLCASDFVFGRL